MSWPRRVPPWLPESSTTHAKISRWGYGKRSLAAERAFRIRLGKRAHQNSQCPVTLCLQRFCEGNSRLLVGLDRDYTELYPKGRKLEGCVP